MEFVNQCIPPLDFNIPEYSDLTPISLRTPLFSNIKYKTNHNIQTSSGKANEQVKQYDILWSFENTVNDINNLYPGFLMNNPFYIDGYVGKGLCFNGVNQYVDTTAPIDFLNRSFTVEVWVYWIDLYNYTFNGIFGQCSCDNTCISRCLHLLIRDKYAYLGFYENDLKGHTIIENSTWTHITYVYDYSQYGQQEVYVNGLLDGRRTGKAYQGVTSNSVIGKSFVSAGVDSGQYFTGIIDQLSVTFGIKTAKQILDDATLCAYYSFDQGSLADFGPNGLNGTAMNTVSIKGHVNQALKFSMSTSYFQAAGFTALATSNKAFSIAFWINPLQIDKGTILFVSNTDDSWCLPFIGFTSNGTLVAQIKSDQNTIISTMGPTLEKNIWTHIAITYSRFNGQRIYINGFLHSSSPKNISYSASEQSNYITVGTSLAFHSQCNQSKIQSGQFYGSIDELRIYSRELIGTDIRTFINI
ncbi:unnamed protein product [Adineta ricciae]|uniref:LamG-like jellyroll fold domain-containing protein n=1 Tax=Adineta ricciae TaxID=249248 RepID=A0A814R6N5_ADIRI|nr:unnamed protein product [Adineta ricciae]